MKRILFLVFAVSLIIMLALPFAVMAEESPPVASAVDLTPIFQALIALLASIITVKVIPWIKSKISSEQQLAMMATVKIMVYAAEQIYGSGHGNEKLAWVKESLLAKGYKLDTALLKEMIEAQVRELTVEQEKANL